MNALLLVAFIIAFGNMAFHLGQGDMFGTAVSGIIATLCVVVGIATARS